MEYLADYFELVVPRVDDSAVFRYHTAIPAEMLRRAAAYDFSYGEQSELMDRAIRRLPEEHRYYVQLAGIVHRASRGDKDVLREELNHLQQRFRNHGKGYTGNSYFEQVRSRIDELEAWHCNQAGDFGRCLELADAALAQRPGTYTMALRGCALIGLERYREAEEQLRKALDCRQPAACAYVELARALMYQERLQEAEMELLRGLHSYPADEIPSGYYLYVLKMIWRRDKSLPDKTDVIAMLRSTSPVDPEVWALDSWFQWKSGESDAAQLCLARAIELGLPDPRLEELREEMQLPL
jgi:tetratricopeptide (TPR) repeat protein